MLEFFPFAFFDILNIKQFLPTYKKNFVFALYNFFSSSLKMFPVNQDFFLGVWQFFAEISTNHTRQSKPLESTAKSKN